jgi:transcriptional regulator with XRE-family HTH domain
MGQVNATREGRRKRTAAVTRSRPVEEATGSVRLGGYLRRLREGYGYTLRKVEEQAVALGEAIDNSQLSRFEKGKAVPSFEKLRALGRVFNVPVQNFSDVLDLEEYQHLKPKDRDYAKLIRDGFELMSRGEAGKAFVTYERAFEVAQRTEDPDKRIELAAQARYRMASSLKALGKLFMTEQELRAILKDRSRLSRGARLRTLLQLSYLYRELGDLYLASVLARESLELARKEGDLGRQAGVLNTLGNIQHDEGDIREAANSYSEALSLLDAVVGHEEMKATVMTNLGGCHVSLGRFEKGVELLRRAYARAYQGSFRRVASLAQTRLAEASLSRNDYAQARGELAQSDSLATRPEGCFHDILFLNAFHRWRMERAEGNGTGEKIAFGRLRHLRSLLQRRFPEVDAFDKHVQRTRR